MRIQQINRVSSKILTFLSFLALIAVLCGYLEPPQPDEGSAAHIFQLSIVAFVLMTFLYLGTADWKQPFVRPLAFPVAIVALAFGALYYLEHFR